MVKFFNIGAFFHFLHRSAVLFSFFKLHLPPHSCHDSIVYLIVGILCKFIVFLNPHTGRERFRVFLVVAPLFKSYFFKFKKVFLEQGVLSRYVRLTFPELEVIFDFFLQSVLFFLFFLFQSLSIIHIHTFIIILQALGWNKQFKLKTGRIDAFFG